VLQQQEATLTATSRRNWMWNCTGYIRGSSFRAIETWPLDRVSMNTMDKIWHLWILDLSSLAGVHARALKSDLCLGGCSIDRHLIAREARLFT
jgi:hypothetical protein